MSRLVVLIVPLLLVASSFAQQPDPQTAACSFDDGKEISIRYMPVKAGEKPINGRPWTPANSPILLFTQAELAIANVPIPVGAYSLYAIPGKDNWSLVVNKNVNAGAAYDGKQDLVRAPMETGELNPPTKELAIAFAHLGPQLCSVRLYYGKAGSYAEFKEK
jgi:hypothetical protein